MLSLESHDSSVHSEIMIKDTLLFNELQDIILNNKIRTVFQPIVSLANGSVLGYEALSRGPKGSNLERPDAFFRIARKYNFVWELELLCRSKVFEQAHQIPIDKLLFLNVDPKILNDPRFQHGFIQEHVRRSNSRYLNNIILEITEGTAIQDYTNFKNALKYLVSQGYKIAIDDTGAGYSGLNMLAQINPHFIKVDMDLVRDIDKDSVKQALMKAFYEFSVLTNMKIIAEGIETAAELNELIQIGIPYGQGFYLHKPSSDIRDIPDKIKQQIINITSSKEHENYHTPITMPIGDITRLDGAVPPDALGYQVIDYFNDNYRTMGVCVVEGKRPVGLLMKDKFCGKLATQYGVALYMHRKISLVMDKNPIIVDYYMPLEQVSKIAVSRSEEKLYDYIIVTKNEEYYGVITIRRLLEKTTQLELNRAKHSNPLTGLPGNILIENEIKQVLADNKPYTVLYFDLDNFKAYNDVYGFESGDQVLCLIAQIIQQELYREPSLAPFVGHIGGDDFIAVVKDWNIKAICEKIIKLFDNQIRSRYLEDDLAKGYILAKNRHGQDEKFPIISLSIAAVTNEHQIYHSTQQIAESATVLKKKCKLSWRSCYCVDGMINNGALGQNFA